MKIVRAKYREICMICIMDPSTQISTLLNHRFDVLLDTISIVFVNYVFLITYIRIL